VTVGSSTGEGNSAISSRVCPATSGKKASTNALASAGVLYIFQLAAISALRDMFRVPQFNFMGSVSEFRVTVGTAGKGRLRRELAVVLGLRACSERRGQIVGHRAFKKS